MFWSKHLCLLWYLVPEAATILFSNGATQFNDETTELEKIEFQGTLLKLQMSLEVNVVLKAH